MLHPKSDKLTTKQIIVRHEQVLLAVEDSLKEYVPKAYMGMVCKTVVRRVMRALGNFERKRRQGLI